MLPQYGSFTQAYYATLLRLFSDATHVTGVKDENSPGLSNDFFERLGEGFTLTDPLDRIPRQEARNFNLKSAIALTALLFSGSQTIDEISVYNPRAEAFADDKKHMLGAHGYRAKDQLWGAIRLLRSDPTTRRAMIAVYGPDDVLRRGKDIPCVATLHFLIRGGKLDLCVQMRSQSAIMVMPYDVFSFTVLHELMAHELRVPVGFYHHYCNSLHYFDTEQGFLHKILDDGAPPLQKAPVPFFEDPTDLSLLGSGSLLAETIWTAKTDFHTFVNHHYERYTQVAAPPAALVSAKEPPVLSPAVWREWDQSSHDRG